MEKLTLKKVAKRRKELVKYHLWDAPDTDVIDAWTRQFETPDDKKLAMIALDALIVKSKESALSALWYLLSSVLPDILGTCVYSRDHFGAVSYEVLRGRDFTRHIKIHRLERPTGHPGAGQSSDDIIRTLKYTHSANSEYFNDPETNTSHILLVDEFSGSGNQARKAITEWRVHLPASIKISVFFVAIHQTGLALLKEELPDVNIYTTEILGDESCLFTHIKNVLGLSAIEQAKDKLSEFTRNNFAKERGVSLLGYRGMALCFKPPFSACNNMAGLYLMKTKHTNVRLFGRGL
jgi:hypothetical protein